MTRTLQRDVPALPSGARVLLLGADWQARAWRRVLLGSRADVTVVGFVEQGGHGTVERLPVWSPDRAAGLAEWLIVPDGATAVRALESIRESPRHHALAVRHVTPIERPHAYAWLDEAVSRVVIDRPVLLLGKGPGLSLVPPDAHRTHFVLAVNGAAAAVEESEGVFVLDADQLCHLLFAPGVEGRVRRFFLPDGIMSRFDNVCDEGLLFGAEDFSRLTPRSTPEWGWDRMVPFEEVDALVDFGWIAAKVVRYRLQNVYSDAHVHPEWPHLDPDLEAFRPQHMSEAHLLKSACNSAHLALSFLFRAGVRDLLTAGMGADPGYADVVAGPLVRMPTAPAQSVRWQATCRVLERLGMQSRRLEDCGAEERRRLFA